MKCPKDNQKMKIIDRKEQGFGVTRYFYECDCGYRYTRPLFDRKYRLNGWLPAIIYALENHGKKLDGAVVATLPQSELDDNKASHYRKLLEYEW